MNCIFCDIVNEKTPAEIVYKEDKLLVIKDKNPHAPVHLLIIPRKHIRSINDLTPEDNDIIAHMINTGRDRAKAAGISESGYKLLFNVERGGGQMIFHLHLHLLGGWK